MPDELAGHSEDDKHAAILQKLSITHAAGSYLVVFYATIVKRDVTQVDLYITRPLFFIF